MDQIAIYSGGKTEGKCMIVRVEDWHRERSKKFDGQCLLRGSVFRYRSSCGEEGAPNMRIRMRNARKSFCGEWGI